MSIFTYPASPHRRDVAAWLAALATFPTSALSASGPNGELVRLTAGDEALHRFYQLRGWTTAWPEAQAKSLIGALSESDRHGIDAARFLAPLRAPSSAELDVRLTAAGLAYARALAHGLADPAKLLPIFTLERNKVDVVAGLSAALDRGNVAGWLASLPPKEPAYGLLSEAYLAARRDIAQPRPEIKPGRLIRPGETDERIPAVRAALEAKGWGSEQPPADLSLFDATLAQTIKDFQALEGLKVDGVVGPDTLDALNAGPADRARQIALSLERWRWLERLTPPTRIDVNTAAATLSYYRDGQLIRRLRTVVGRADTQTPALGASFSRLVLNPPWRVPSSIARREILPRGTAYLRRNNMYVRNGRVVQRPGPRSALGLVKFDMQNPYAIYLHDTPAKALFAGNDRHRSHGCVRVDDAVAFARLLASERGREAALERALSSGRTTVVDLPEAIPVRLLYRTAFVVGGKVQFAPDHYGRDAVLAAALGMPPEKRPHPRPYSAIPFGP